MEALSPFTRRLVALGILFVAVVSLLNLVVVPAINAFRGSLGWLGDSRFQRVQVEAVAARPLASPGAPLPPGANIVATTRDQAVAQLANAIRQSAAASGVTPSGLGPATGDDVARGLIAVDLAAAGKEQAIVGFIERLEQGRPLARVARWHLTRGDGPGADLRLDARVLAAWGPR